MLRKDFIVFAVPFACQNQCGAGVESRAYMSDRKEIHYFRWGTNKGDGCEVGPTLGSMYHQWQYDYNVDRMTKFLKECLEKKEALEAKK
jgi:hypothetical protein